MAKGVVAFIIVVALTLAISIMAGLGFYSSLGVDYTTAADDDVQNAANAMIGQEASDKSSGSVLQDFTTSAGRTLATGWQVIANLSGILQLLFGLPDVLANNIQTFWQITFSITFAAFIRGVVLQ
jgi:hypothetical protein